MAAQKTGYASGTNSFGNGFGKYDRDQFPQGVIDFQWQPNCLRKQYLLYHFCGADCSGSHYACKKQTERSKDTGIINHKEDAYGI